jgi:glycerol-3-phosphate acyltransferase PlsY
MWSIVAGILISYLIGSVPTAYLFGRFLKGIDIRTQGSGNVGATNAVRVLGKPVGLAVLAIDIIKGFLPVFFVADLFGGSDSTRFVFGAAAIAGHNWPVFLGFRGGKGVATSLGVLLGLAGGVLGVAPALALTVGLWFLIYRISKFVSLASVISAIVLPFFLIAFHSSALTIIVVAILSSFVVLRHKSNISKLLQKKETPTKIF